jgi:hypothetical protein
MKHLSLGPLLKPSCEFEYGFEFIEIFECEHFSALLPSTPIIFSRSGQQSGKMMGVVGNNAEKKHMN